MDALARLRRRWYLVILAAIIAVGVGASTIVTFKHGSPKVKHEVYRVGTGVVLLDTNPSILGNTTANSGALGGRAELIAQYSTGPNVVKLISSLAGVPLSKLSVEAQTTSATKTGGASSKSVVVGHGRESVLLNAKGHGQTITVTSQAHSDKLARALVSATIRAMTISLRKLQLAEAYNHVSTTTTSTTSTSTTKTAPPTTGKTTGKGGGKNHGGAANAAKAAAAAKARAAKLAQEKAAAKARAVQQSQIVLRQLGSITAAKVVSGSSKTKAVGYTIVVFLVLLLLIVMLDSLVRPREPAPVAVTPQPTRSED